MISKMPDVAEAVRLNFLEKISFLKKSGDMREQPLVGQIYVAQIAEFLA
jgi:hypothetical protein